MPISKKPYKGCRDLFPEQKRTQDYLFDIMKQTASSFGYEPYDGPMLEEVELYRAKSGQELINDQIYSFTDRGKREVAIRPEMTPTVARMVAQIHREVPKPIRWYSIPNLMRYERPQRGRLREHWQFNVDLFGPSSIYSELEILSLVRQLFSNFGANEEHFEILINNRKFIDFFFQETLSLTSEKSLELYKLVDRVKKLKPEAFEEQLNNVGLNQDQVILFNEYLSLQSFDDFKTFTEKVNFPVELWDVNKFFTALSSLNLLPYVKYDASIVRGLDYYTGIVFEVFDKHPDNRRALCGGGAYEGLMSIFGEEQLPGVGFGLGDVTLTDFLISHELLPDLSKNQIEYLVATEEENLEGKVLEISVHIRSLSKGCISQPEKLKFKKINQLISNSNPEFLVQVYTDNDELKLKVKKLADKTQEVSSFENYKEIIK